MPVGYCFTSKPCFSFSLFAQRESDKPDKMNVWLTRQRSTGEVEHLTYSWDCCLWTLSDDRAIQVITIETNLIFFFSQFRGVWVFGVWVFGVWGLRSEFSGSEFSWHPDFIAQGILANFSRRQLLQIPCAVRMQRWRMRVKDQRAISDWTRKKKKEKERKPKFKPRPHCLGNYYKYFGAIG